MLKNARRRTPSGSVPGVRSGKGVPLGKKVAELKTKSPAAKPRFEDQTDLKKLIDAIATAARVSGSVELDVSPVPSVSVVEETPVLREYLGLSYVQVLFNYLQQKVGPGAGVKVFNTARWQNVTTLMENLVKQAARGSLLSVDTMPRQLAYALNCLRKKAGLKFKDKSLTYSFSGVAGDTPDGTTTAKGGAKATAVFNSGTGQNLFQWWLPVNEAQVTTGGFIQLVSPDGPGPSIVYNQAETIKTLGALWALADDWETVKSTETRFGKMDATRSVDAFQKISNPGYIPVTGVTGFQSDFIANKPYVDARIAQLQATAPTDTTPDPREGKVKSVLSGGPEVGWMMTNTKGTDVFNPARTFVRFVPFDLGTGFSLFLRVFFRQMRNVYGPDLTGVPPNLFNHLELLVLYLNLVIPIFKNSNAGGGVIFPNTPTETNPIGMVFDGKNFPTTISTSLLFSETFIERLRDMLGAPLCNYPGETKTSIMRVPVLVGDPEIDYTAGVAAEAVRVFDPIRAALVFPPQPLAVDGTGAHLTGFLEPMTGTWTQDPSTINAIPVNYTSGAIVTKIMVKWNNNQELMAQKGRITSCVTIKGQGTVNRDVQILRQGDSDTQMNPITGAAYVLVSCLSEKDVKAYAVTLRKAGFEPSYLIRNWMAQFVVGRVGGRDYDKTNYTTAYALPFDHGEAGASYDAVISTKASNITPMPMQGTDGSEYTESEKVEIHHGEGGFLGFGWNDAQIKEVHEMVASGEGTYKDLGMILEKLMNNGYPQPLIRAIKGAPNVIKAISILKRRVGAQKFLSLMDKVVKAVVGVVGTTL